MLRPRCLKFESVGVACGDCIGLLEDKPAALMHSLALQMELHTPASTEVATLVVQWLLGNKTIPEELRWEKT
eukprot:4011463-Amphidinium_carterae.1